MVPWKAMLKGMLLGISVGRQVFFLQKEVQYARKCSAGTVYVMINYD